MIDFSGGEGEFVSGFRTTVPTTEGGFATLIVFADSEKLAKKALKDYRKNSNPINIIKTKPEFIQLSNEAAFAHRRDIIRAVTVWMEEYVNIDQIPE